MSDDHPVALDKVRFRPGKGLHVSSADNAFALETRMRAQILYTTAKVEDEDWEQSIELRRARLQFGGHVFGEDNEFKFELAVSPSDTAMRSGSPPQTSPLLDYYFEFKQLDNLNLRVGQYKVPYSRERVISSGDLRMVDRTILNMEFNLDRDIGLDIRSEDFLQLDLLRYYLGIYLGEGRNSYSMNDFGMMYIARVELLPFGTFKDYREADLEISKSPKLSIGFAYAYLAHAANNQGILGSAPADGGTTNFHHVTADVVFRVMGVSVEGVFMWRDGERDPGDVQTEGELVIEDPRNGWGVSGQAGVLVAGTGFELVARTSILRAAEDSSLTEADEYGLGLNYYFAGHPFKLQADVFRLGEKEPGANAYAWENRIRVQLQAGF